MVNLPVDHAKLNEAVYTLLQDAASDAELSHVSKIEDLGTRWYSDESNNGKPKAIDSLASKNEKIEAKPSASESDVDTLDDATLEQLFYGGRTVASGGDDALTKAQEETLYREGTIPPPAEAEALVAAAETAEQEADSLVEENELHNPGHKFGLPKRPWPENYSHKKRYHPVLEQITRLLMRDGKLSVAQRNMAMVINYLRTAPPPIYSPKFPLLPGTPPAAHLPLNPIPIRNVAGAGGGGRALELPIPLAVRQRRRIAFNWILDVVNKRPSKGSGRKQLPNRIADEIISVVEGRSGVWEKRKIIHKSGTSARANVGSSKLKQKKKM
ncbi:hypothetical protein G7046_g4169 [Stylonectria norvegica]|nr:hypothetical protein G7046_g4169 [Stylonectria norvegica]